MCSAVTRSCRSGGEEWLEVVERTPGSHRHLAVHDGHCLYLNEADAAAWDAGARQLIEGATLTGSRGAVRERLAGYAEQGDTEIVYQPVGDVRRELEAFAAAAQEGF
jgi:5,10-methylenetetrahydromethanopterin reductase